MPRYAKKIDNAQPEIVEGLRELPGVSVALDKDDILVGYRGQTFWIEIKSSAKSGLQPSQKKLKAEWAGHYAVCWTLDMVLKEIDYGIPEQDIRCGGGG